MAHAAQKLPSENLKFTYEDYLVIPDDGKRYEIIEGELFMTPAPILKHQDILREFSNRIDSFVKKNNLGIVFFAPCDVIFSKTNIVQPDILFISKKNRAILAEKNIQGAPDLLVEIISPSTEERDVVFKKKLYSKFGVKEYWIVYPNEDKVEVFSLQNNGYQLHGNYEKKEVLISPLLKGLEINLSEIFRELDEYF